MWKVATAYSRTVLSLYLPGFYFIRLFSKKTPTMGKQSFLRLGNGGNDILKSKILHLFNDFWLIHVFPFLLSFFFIFIFCACLFFSFAYFFLIVSFFSITFPYFAQFWSMEVRRICKEIYLEWRTVNSFRFVDPFFLNVFHHS